MPADERRSTDRELSDLAALADGSLPPERRAEVEARVAASPRLQALLREQQQALEAVRGRGERAPQRLHDAVARLPRTRRPPARRAALAAGFAASATAVAMLVLPGSEPRPPALTEAAALAARAPTSAEPSGAGGGAALAGMSAWGLEYPDLSRGGGWRPSGSRTDTIDGRAARTVFYSKDGSRIAYTILAPGEVRVPKGTASWRRKGRPWYAFDDHGRTVVAWERDGHMCVVSVNGVGRRALVDLITR
jgi:hypothetical protein